MAICGQYSPKQESGHRWWMDDLFLPSYCLKCKDMKKSARPICPISDDEYINGLPEKFRKFWREYKFTGKLS